MEGSDLPTVRAQAGKLGTRVDDDSEPHFDIVSVAIFSILGLRKETISWGGPLETLCWFSLIWTSANEAAPRTDEVNRGFGQVQKAPRSTGRQHRVCLSAAAQASCGKEPLSHRVTRVKKNQAAPNPGRGPAPASAADGNPPTPPLPPVVRREPPTPDINRSSSRPHRPQRPTTATPTP